MTLFIDYANTDLRKNPRFLLKFSEYLDWHYREIHKQAGHSEIPEVENDDIVYFNKPIGCGSPHFEDVVEKVLSINDALQGDIENSYPYLYAAAACRSHKGYLGTAFEICAFKGVFYWAMNDHGCDECRYNWAGHREAFLRDGKIPCFICDWLAFREMLSAKAAENHIKGVPHDLLEAYNTFNHKEVVVRKSGDLEEYEYLSLNLTNQDWLAAPQRFSQIIMAALWHDINRFLSKEKAKSTSPNPAVLIKQCRICGKFFIASRSNATNCNNCTGKEPQEVLRERQARRRAQSEHEALNELREMGRKRGKSDSEINEILNYFMQNGYSTKDILMMPETEIFPPEM
jgi:hypothetical protein